MLNLGCLQSTKHLIFLLGDVVGQLFLREIEALGVPLHTSAKFLLLDTLVHCLEVVALSLLHSLGVKVLFIDNALLLEWEKVDLFYCFGDLFLVLVGHFRAFDWLLETGSLKTVLRVARFEGNHIKHVLLLDLFLLLLSVWLSSLSNCPRFLVGACLWFDDLIRRFDQIGKLVEIFWWRVLLRIIATVLIFFALAKFVGTLRTFPIFVRELL